MGEEGVGGIGKSGIGGGTKGREEASFCERVKLGMENEGNRGENVSLFSLPPFLFPSPVRIRGKERRRKICRDGRIGGIQIGVKRWKTIECGGEEGEEGEKKEKDRERKKGEKTGEMTW